MLKRLKKDYNHFSQKKVIFFFYMLSYKFIIEILKEKVLKQKYDELEKTGKLDKFIQEKKKRQSDKVYWQLSNLVKIKEKKMDK